MDEFLSNSQSAPKPTEKKIDPIVTTGVTRRKTPLGTRFKETFLSGADSRSVFEYVFTDIIVPQVKGLVVDSTTQAIQRAVLGASSGHRGGYRYGGPPTVTQPARTRYDGYSSGSSPSYRQPGMSVARRDAAPPARQAPAFEDILLDNRGSADRVLDTMQEILNEYSFVSVADLYGLLGITPAFTDNKYGWESLAGARISAVRGGQYLIDLPKPGVID